ncbi:hypothetical protein IC232_03935 [Microvirga sp. BT688]|uniref:hypothetical protein n=1 Tax=Microvirga sp. TaxID=1873136 RepID=UPI001683D670|nr:hypothetical protein [Microvirga sp.]MBD2745842.1 hypothetical protein [Microvirga sp.]
MSAEHDRIFGQGTGSGFVSGAYLQDLPRAVDQMSGRLRYAPGPYPCTADQIVFAPIQDAFGFFLISDPRKTDAPWVLRIIETGETFQFRQQRRKGDNQDVLVPVAASEAGRGLGGELRLYKDAAGEIGSVSLNAIAEAFKRFRIQNDQEPETSDIPPDGHWARTGCETMRQAEVASGTGRSVQVVEDNSQAASRNPEPTAKPSGPDPSLAHTLEATDRSAKEQVAAPKTEAARLKPIPVSVPQFPDYPVNRIHKGTNAKPILDDPNKNSYRTRIREAAQQQANFAGRYVITTWGCGTGCNRGAVINLATGKVKMLPFGLVTAWSNSEEESCAGGPDFGFELNSSLIVMTGKFEYNEDTWNDPSGGKGGLHYFVFDGSDFRYLKTVNGTDCVVKSTKPDETDQTRQPLKIERASDGSIDSRNFIRLWREVVGEHVAVEFCTVYMVGMSTPSCAVYDGAKRVGDIILDRGTLDLGSMKWVLANCSGPVPKSQCNTRVEGLVQDADGKLVLTNVTVAP